MSVLKIKNKKGEWVGITSIKGEKGDPGDIASHAACHASDSTDPITPSQIGAALSDHNHDERYYTEAEVNSLLAQNAPFPTWGEEDIIEGDVSYSPTGTVHYVIE